MALVIENGSGVAGADSYATAAQLADRAAAYGWTLPLDVEAQEVLLRRAAVQMNSPNSLPRTSLWAGEMQKVEVQWKGRRVSASQPLAWPRTGVELDGELLPDTLIPGQIQYGQMALAAEIYADDLDPPELRQGPVKREKVDVLEVEYSAVVNDGRLLRAAPDRPAAVQFSGYLERVTRPLYVPAIRA